MTTRKGYLVALAVLVVGLAVAAIAMWRLYQRVEGFARIEMPGEGTVNLPAGDLVVYAEGVPGLIEDFSTRCEAADATDAVLPFGSKTGSTNYTLGGRSGTSILELDVPKAGPVTIRCTSDRPFVLAIGPGLGLGIAVAGLSAIVGVFGALGIAFRTWRRRRRERRAVPTAVVVGS
jgi:hypothetical protein